MVHPEDRDLQRILWRKMEENKFQLNTVTYGLTCAPYLAIRVLRQLANNEESRFSLGAETLCRDIYMDDVLTGASTVEVDYRLREQVSSLCMAGGFPLRKWAANHVALLDGVPLEHRLQLSADALLPSADHSVLGLRWSPATDDFALTVRRSTGVPSTKRTILSQTARLFDPLGWLAPIIIRAKFIIQAAWLHRLEGRPVGRRGGDNIDESGGASPGGADSDTTLVLWQSYKPHRSPRVFGCLRASLRRRRLPSSD
ncbi:hypothetical protein RF55_14807 [Lasius niger]|uniref:Gag-pol polyprotein n=1 Tax=Lasius niger TaxID=67767 RepID=A0A0J7K7M1_LASNI|nr:hypothetical protein RF55_14807 [Lasius niger]